MMVRTAVSLFLLLNVALSEKEHLEIVDDSRTAFSIESFGFVQGGSVKVKCDALSRFHRTRDNTKKTFPIQIDLEKLKIVPESDTGYTMGFILRRTDSISTASTQLVQDVQTDVCTLTSSTPSSGNVIFRVFPNNFTGETITFQHTFSNEIDEGLYDFEFERCSPRGEFATTFTISFEMKNSDTNYLSAGDAPLPTLYIIFSSCFFAAFAYWTMFLLKNRSNIHKIHYIMSALVFVKAFSLILESVTWHYIKTQGTPLDWIYIDDAVKAVKGIMLFGVILLIGSGWSFMKPFFNEREKRIVYIVVPLQVVANIAMVWVDESAPGMYCGERSHRFSCSIFFQFTYRFTDLDYMEGYSCVD